MVPALSWQRPGSVMPVGASGSLVVAQDALDQERPHLLPLPEHPFLCELVRSVVSGKTPYIRFDGNDYSIPHTLLNLGATDTVVRLVDGTTEVAHHVRRHDQGQRIEDPAHLAAFVREKRRAHDLRGRDRLRQSCPRADEFLQALAGRGAPLAPQTLALLQGAVSEEKAT